MLGKGVVARVVGRYGHDGTRTISGQHIVANPDGHSLARERIDGIRAREDTRHAAVADAFAFGTLLGTVQVGFHFSLLGFGCHLWNQFAFRRQYHERYAEHRIGTGGKDGEFEVAVLYLELNFGTFRAAYPVALCFFQRVGPVDGLQSVEQTLGVGRYTQTPLAHLLLYNGITAAFRYAVHHFVVGKYRAQLRTPVHHRFAQVGDAVVHQRLLLLLFAHGLPFVGCEAQFLATSRVDSFGAIGFESLHQLDDGLCLLQLVVVIALEHLLESPLCPVIIFGVAGAYFAVPVEREAYLVELFAIAVDIVDGGNCRVLASLDGILLGGKAVGIVTHRVQYVEALQSFVAGVDVRSDVSQRMSHVQTCTRGVGEHVQYIEFLFRIVFRYLIGLVVHPSFLPFLFNLPEIVFHTDVC